MSFSIGDTVGDYRILEEIGRGGMGRVFKVEHTVTRRLEAMKILAGGRPDVAQQEARSLREIQLQASLDHPNIAAVHNAFWAGEDLVLVMELIQGLSLRRILEAGRVSLAASLDYAGQALSALSYAHGHGVDHRDISPGNMMIDSTGVLKLTDFGLAKGPADARLSQSGAPLGSLWYMSPEQVQGSPSDARSDIYSLGAVLYELVAGKKPFDGESAFAIMADQVGKSPEPPIEVDPAVPQGLSEALLRALQKDPDQRFQSAQEFQRAVTRIQNSVNTPEPGSRPIARRRAFGLAAAVVCLSAAAILVSRWPNSPANAAPITNLESSDRRADADKGEPHETPSTLRTKPAKQATRKTTKSGPSLFRKALRPIWPFSKRDKRASGDRNALNGPADQ